jgi:TM2 domain-containing membrane protein YozV
MNEDRFHSTDEIFCSSCGAKIHKDAQFCSNCSAKVHRNYSYSASSQDSPAKGVSEEWLLVLLLACFFGTFGIHRFYVGKIGTGILMLITGGGCGIWTIFDIIIIATGRFSKKNGEFISRIP